MGDLGEKHLTSLSQDISVTGRTNKMQLVLMLSFDALEALSGGIKLSEITSATHLFSKMLSFIHSLKVSLIR